MFIAVVPIVLVAALAWIGGYILINQLAAYLVTSELDRRIDSLDTAARSIVRSAPADRPAVMRRMIELFYSEHNPGLEVLLREGGKTIRYPENGTLPEPRPGWKDARGVLLRDGQFYAWSHRNTNTGDVTITAPLDGRCSYRIGAESGPGNDSRLDRMATQVHRSAASEATSCANR